MVLVLYVLSRLLCAMDLLLQTRRQRNTASNDAVPVQLGRTTRGCSIPRLTSFPPGEQLQRDQLRADRWPALRLGTTRIIRRLSRLGQYVCRDRNHIALSTGNRHSRGYLSP